MQFTVQFSARVNTFCYLYQLMLIMISLLGLLYINLTISNYKQRRNDIYSFVVLNIFLWSAMCSIYCLKHVRSLSYSKWSFTLHSTCDDLMRALFFFFFFLFFFFFFWASNIYLLIKQREQQQIAEGPLPSIIYYFAH